MQITRREQSRGFTLIELSIVLVIIGLIIGGVFVGRDLISASEVRAQIAQIEKYNSAVNTFRNKYGGLPGDLNLTLVSQFGFIPGGGCDGSTISKRNGDGLLDGVNPWFLEQAIGEVELFWQDLSQVSLVDGTYPNSGGPAITCNWGNGTSLTSTTIGQYFPAAKIGHGNFVYVYETKGNNWYGVSAITSITNGVMLSSPTIPVIQAYNIDKKIDDGFPTTGSVLAAYINNNITIVQVPNAQMTDSTTSCYNTTNNAYSISATANQGAGLNCALSFRFQ